LLNGYAIRNFVTIVSYYYRHYLRQTCSQSEELCNWLPAGSQLIGMFVGRYSIAVSLDTDHFSHGRQMMIIVLGNEVEVIYEAHRLLEARVDKSSPELPGLDFF
jgi:hypothetical protein